MHSRRDQKKFGQFRAHEQTINTEEKRKELNLLDCRIPGHKMANLKHCYRGAAVVYLKHCYRGAAVVLSRCARSPIIVKPGYKIATVEPRLSGFLDYPDFFSAPNLVMIIYSHDQDS